MLRTTYTSKCLPGLMQVCLVLEESFFLQLIPKNMKSEQPTIYLFLKPRCFLWDIYVLSVICRKIKSYLSLLIQLSLPLLFTESFMQGIKSYLSMLSRSLSQITANLLLLLTCLFINPWNHLTLRSRNKTAKEKYSHLDWFISVSCITISKVAGETSPLWKNN